MREIKHLSVHQWLRSAIPDSQQPTSPIGLLFLKLPPPPCAVLLVFKQWLKEKSGREKKNSLMVAIILLVFTHHMHQGLAAVVGHI